MGLGVRDTNCGLGVPEFKLYGTLQLGCGVHVVVQVPVPVRAFPGRSVLTQWHLTPLRAAQYSMFFSCVPVSEICSFLGWVSSRPGFSLVPLFQMFAGVFFSCRVTACADGDFGSRTRWVEGAWIGLSGNG